MNRRRWLKLRQKVSNRIRLLRRPNLTLYKNFNLKSLLMGLAEKAFTKLLKTVPEWGSMGYCWGIVLI